MLDSFKWYAALYKYSRPSSGDAMDEDDILGPDGDLVSAMISSSVVPRLYKIIRGGGYDVYSSKHMRSLIDLAEQVEASATPDKFEVCLFLCRCLSLISNSFIASRKRRGRDIPGSR